MTDKCMKRCPASRLIRGNTIKEHSQQPLQTPETLKRRLTIRRVNEHVEQPELSGRGGSVTWWPSGGKREAGLLQQSRPPSAPALGSQAYTQQKGARVFSKGREPT